MQRLCSRVCVRGHQESSLTLRSEDRSVANAPRKPRKATFNAKLDKAKDDQMLSMLSNISSKARGDCKSSMAKMVMLIITILIIAMRKRRITKMMRMLTLVSLRRRSVSQ
jgi:hypothetical protein